MSLDLNALAEYLAVRDAQRAEDVTRTLDALSPRERQLVREAAVMGYVQGVRYADAIGRVTIPPDRVIVHRVVDACRAFDDLYPLLGGRATDDGSRTDG